MRAIYLITLLPLSIGLSGCGDATTPPGGSNLTATTAQKPTCNGNVGICTCQVTGGACQSVGEKFIVDASCNAQFCSNTVGNCGLACQSGQWCTNGQCASCNGTVSYEQDGYVNNNTGQTVYAWVNVCTPSVTPVNPGSTLCGANSSWVQVDPGVKLTQISVGGDGSVWATNGTTTYIRTNVNGVSVNGDTWSSITPNDGFSVMGVGSFNNVWATKSLANGNVFYRTGVTTGDKNGTGWGSIAGACSWISAASDYSLWCISTSGLPYYRVGTSQTNPQGTSWSSVGGGLTTISVGNASTVWGINPSNQIYTRTGASSSNPGGTGWTQVDTAFKDVSAGSDGTVWAVNTNGNVFQRLNNGWTPNSNVILKRVAVGNANNVWGIDSTGSAVRCMNN